MEIFLNMENGTKPKYQKVTLKAHHLIPDIKIEIEIKLVQG